MGNYAHPEMLVSTDWVAEHRSDEGIRLLEVDVDTGAYEEGHIEGSAGLDWTSQLCDQVRRDVLSKKDFETLCSNAGISNDTTVVFYGDNNNWFACYALWQFRYYGHTEDNLKVMNGGRSKWFAEGRALAKEIPSYPSTSYNAQEPDANVRAMAQEIFPHLDKNDINLVDVRSPAEFSGEVIAPPGMNETAQRGGHIPSATSIPWAQAVQDDGSFKSYDELKQLYERKGVDLETDAIAYCRIGERSSHTWFVLKYLLGIQNVENYDGSWTEWGNLVGAPIEKT
ncbi:MAG: sulfurtransferase [Kiritimatiellae bacterium]|nr:sulfurtransferase [Kiritimatiellia bacterium]